MVCFGWGEFEFTKNAKKKRSYQEGKEIRGLEALHNLVRGEDEVAGDKHTVNGVDYSIGSKHVRSDNRGIGVEVHGAIDLRKFPLAITPRQDC